MKFQQKKVALALAHALGGTALIAGMPADAQDIRVTVTGTNIPRTQTETAAPIETITREDIQASGLQTIQEVVRQLTANNNGSIAPSFTNGFSASGTAVSLRGLGPNNTLVLVNGRRLANFGLADDGHASYPDLSQLPFDAVERIEVLKDGASAIYGSDAVAGVVNVILRQNFTGVTATATGGVNYNGEGDNFKAAVTGGIGDLTKDKYNAFVSVDYQKQKAIAANTGRDYIGTNDLRYMGLADRRRGIATSYSPTSSTRQSELGNVFRVDPTTNEVLAGAGVPLNGTCPPEKQRGIYCMQDPKDWTDLQPEIERFNVYARGAYNFTPEIQGYAELSLFETKTETRGRPTAMRALAWYDPSRATVYNSINLNLPVGHPDNPFNSEGLAARPDYTDANVGGTNNSYKTDTQRYLLGLKGTTSGWEWDMAGLYIRSDTDVTRRGLYAWDRLQQGLAGTGPYGYYRLGADGNLNNPAVYDWIAPVLSYSPKSENTIFDAKASRDFYKLEGGQMAFAVGYEFRREELDNPGAPGQDTGNVVGLGTAFATGARNVNALYAELYAPILKNLEVTAAIRWDDYSDINESTWNPKVGVKWTVVPAFVLRGTYATAFRAPGLAEAGTNTASGGYSSINDPIRCPVTDSIDDCAGTVFSLNTGNPNLRPETSDTWTVGAIWEPAPGLSATLDYWNIETKDQITLGSAQGVANNPGNFPDALLVRDTNNLVIDGQVVPNSGSIMYVSTPWQNANVVKTDGIDLDVVWRMPVQDWGTFTTEYQWTHVFNYSQTLGGIEYKYVGTSGNYDVSSGSGTPEDRMNLIVSWNKGPWNVAGTVRYVSGIDEIAFQGEPIPDACLSLQFPNPDKCSVSSFTTLDLSASYKGFKNWEIFGSVINVFNRIAPLASAAAYGRVNYNYNYAQSGATGTQFNLGVRYTFQ